MTAITRVANGNQDGNVLVDEIIMREEEAREDS